MFKLHQGYLKGVRKELTSHKPDQTWLERIGKCSLEGGYAMRFAGIKWEVTADF